MATIVTRAGKGSPLTNNEVDANFENLNSDKLESSSYTASDVLSKIKTVDGTGSGLDADTLDGNEATAFATSAQGSNADTAYGWGDHASAGYATYPSQTGNSGKYLTTDGSSPSWDTITAPTPAAVSDAANSSTGYFALPSGTTAQRPGSPAAGYTRMNTTTGSLEFYDGTNWISTNLIPSINSITGTIYAGAASTLTLSLVNATDTVDVKYYEGGTLLATDSGVTVTSGSATSTVPSAVYGQTAGDTISIQVFNQDGTPSSNSISKTVQGLPTGGTITTSGSYRIHTFTSSSSLVVPSGFSAIAEALIVAGGGGGGDNASGHTGGGGGAGGLIDTTVSLTAQTYTITIGAGGAGGGGSGQSGANSVFAGNTAIGGGGGGGNSNYTVGKSGGSGGGGAGRGDTAGGSGTSGQGNSGGRSDPQDNGYENAAGGGGGASASGGNGVWTYGGASVGGSGGNGVNWKSLGTFYAGGGGGGVATNIPSGGGTTYSNAPGGAGGGGTGAQGDQTGMTAGSANTGGGGGGTGHAGNGAAGGSGIVIVRYQLS
jgi:hypothetical protein